MLTASCSLREFDFARSGGSLKKRKGQRQIRLSEKRLNNAVIYFLRLKFYPGLPGPGMVVCTAGSGVRFSTLGPGEGAGEGAAESPDLALARSETLSLENFT